MERKEKRWFKKGDFFLYLFLVGMMTAAFFLFRPTFSQNPILIVKTPEKELWIPMNKPQMVEVKGILGETHIRIDSEGAKIVSSPCSGKDCQKGAALYRSGESRVCLPNRVLVAVKKGKKEKDEVDDLLF